MLLYARLPLLYIKKNWIKESTTFILDAYFSFTIIYKENESGDRKSKISNKII